MEGEVLLETFPVNSRGGEILGKAELFPTSAESSRCSLALAIPALSSIYIHVQANDGIGLHVHDSRAQIMMVSIMRMDSLL